MCAFKIAFKIKFRLNNGPQSPIYLAVVYTATLFPPHILKSSHPGLLFVSLMGPTQSHLRALGLGLFSAWSNAEIALRSPHRHFLLVILQVSTQRVSSTHWDCHWPPNLNYSCVAVATIILNQISLFYFLQGTYLKFACLFIVCPLPLECELKRAGTFLFTAVFPLH